MSPQLSAFLLLLVVLLSSQAAAAAATKNIVNTPVTLSLPPIPDLAQSDADLEYAFAAGRLQFGEDMCSRLSSSSPAVVSFACAPTKLADVQAAWKASKKQQQHAAEGAWRTLAAIPSLPKDDEAVAGGQKLMRSVMEDVLGSSIAVQQQPGDQLSLGGEPDLTGRFVFACSRVPGCLDAALTAEERASLARFLLTRASMTPGVALGLKALQDFGVVSVTVKHEAGSPVAHVHASPLLPGGGALGWRLGGKTSKPISIKQQQQQEGGGPWTEVEINTSKLGKLTQLDLEVALDGEERQQSQVFVLRFPASIQVDQVSVQVKDKGVLVEQQKEQGVVVLEPGQALEVGFQLGGICPEQAVLVFFFKGNSEEEEGVAHFPLTCDEAAGGPSVTVTNTAKLADELIKTSSSFSLVLLVSDDKLAKPERKPLGQVRLVPHPAATSTAPKKELPIFATSLLHESDTTRVPLPEIHHQFRQPDRRAPKLFALVFTGVQLALLAGLGGALHVYGAGFSLARVVAEPRLLFFSAVLSGILAVFVWYWVGLAGAPNMENLTYKYLPPLLVVLYAASKVLMANHTITTGNKKTASM